MTDGQIRKFRQDTLAEKWPERCRTGTRCHQCENELEAYYCEERIYLVRCTQCGNVTIVGAGSPKNAAHNAGGFERE